MSNDPVVEESVFPPPTYITVSPRSNATQVPTVYKRDARSERGFCPQRCSVGTAIPGENTALGAFETASASGACRSGAPLVFCRTHPVSPLARALVSVQKQGRIEAASARLSFSPKINHFP
ncbi:hypothetical protein MRX96_022928 [Rhipicephalus microplus]